MLWFLVYITIAVFAMIIGVAHVNSKPNSAWSVMNQKDRAVNTAVWRAVLWPIVPFVLVFAWLVLKLHDMFVAYFKKRAVKKAKLK